MASANQKSVFKSKLVLSVRWLYGFLSLRAYTVIMVGALFCTLVVKLFHSWRYSLLDEYTGWVLADISFLVGVELILALICFRWAGRWAVRAVTLFAAVICTWSVMNAGWLIRTGTQLLPRVLLPLFRAPVHTLLIIGVNLAKMPLAALILLVPSAVALAFLFAVLARPRPPAYDQKRFVARAVVCIIVVLTAVAVRPGLAKRSSPEIASVGLRYNSQLRAVVSLIVPAYRQLPDPRRQIPSCDELTLARRAGEVSHNVVVVVLEGVQYQYTSLGGRHPRATPYLARLAESGVEFSNMRSTLTHTTKALFALLSGRFPSASQDLAEAVPAARPYASMATILSRRLNYRTAFFQSALGSFESRPGLVSNLGFDEFWARDDLNDPNSHLGYLACDEFAMLEPITEWIRAGGEPFFLTILCSVTHDPYEVPEWFGAAEREPAERYRQAITYTDRFLAALDVEITNLNLADRTIFCVVGDHGEAFGEHGQLGHERIAFDEALRVPFCLRAPFLVEPGRRITDLVSSVDVAPTLLGLLGFKTEGAGFDGINALVSIPSGREVHFCGWMQEGPAGFVKGDRKFIYNPTDRTACVYDLSVDPFETDRIALPEEQARRIAGKVTEWRRSTIFRVARERTGKTVLFGRWHCRWNGRVSSAKYDKSRR